MSGVGAHLEESGEVRAVQVEVPVRHAILDFALVGLHHAPFGRDKLHVEHPADVRGAVALVQHVGLEPHCLAEKVPRIVEMQIYLLLVLHLIDGVRRKALCGQPKGGQQEQGQDVSGVVHVCSAFDFIICFRTLFSTR